MPERHIVSGSAGYTFGYDQVSLGPVIKYGLQLTRKQTPKLCYMGTAGGDDASWIVKFHNACMSKPVIASHLELFPAPNVANVREFILGQDMIWVGGGSVSNLLAVWRVHGLDSIMREAWENGIVLAGVSAGSICWHTGGTTDSFGEELQPVTNGLGFLPHSNGVHYNAHPGRRPLLQSLIQDKTLGEGYATDDGAAIHYIGTEFHKAIADRPNAFAYHIARTDSGIKETKLDTKLLS